VTPLPTILVNIRVVGVVGWWWMLLIHVVGWGVVPRLGPLPARACVVLLGGRGRDVERVGRGGGRLGDEEWWVVRLGRGRVGGGGHHCLDLGLLESKTLEIRLEFIETVRHP